MKYSELFYKYFKIFVSVNQNNGALLKFVSVVVICIIIFILLLLFILAKILELKENTKFHSVTCNA